MTCVFTFITAAVIAETCSSLPLAESIYLWAAEAGGPRFGRSLRTNLPSTTIPNAPELLQAGVESGPTEQAVPSHGSLLERLGGCSSVLSVCLSRFWKDSQLRPRHHG